MTLATRTTRRRKPATPSTTPEPAETTSQRSHDVSVASPTPAPALSTAYVDLDADPLEIALGRVRWLMSTVLGYDPDEIQAVSDHIREHGTAECSPDVKDRDREHIEALLPVSLAWSHEPWDAVFALGPEPAAA